MIVRPLDKCHGVLKVPGDKSITHRAVMLNAVAEGSATVRRALMGEDCLRTIECMRALGAVIETDGDTVKIQGAKKLKTKQTLYVGNSGTTIRLLCGLLAGRHITVTLDGDESIRRRPMNRVIEPLRAMGAKIDSNGGYAPITIHPAKLKGIRHEMTVASAQVKSALLLAGLSAEGETKVIQPAPCRDHTELMLEQMSAQIFSNGNEITVLPGSLKSVNVDVPGDISSAAYPLVLATCLEGSGLVIKNVGVNPTRRAIIDIVNAHGGRITLLNRKTVCGEKTADIMVECGVMRPFELSGSIIPNVIDEIPILAVLAAMASGDTVIRDAQELKVKESNRIDTTVAALTAMGVRAEGTADGMVIHGGGAIMGGARIDPKGDHRIAMSMSVAAALSVEGAEILGEEAVNVSYPNFFESVLNIKK